ncbi:MAG: FAD-dependent oxidoreductase, partial [Candidatus Jordarchaeaceae archaeon]
QMVNIREQCSWVHYKDPKEATEKAKQLVAAGVARARLLEDVPQRKVKVEPAVLVAGGGIAGISAALTIANHGLQVYLVERKPTIGGLAAQLDRTFATDDCAI